MRVVVPPVARRDIDDILRDSLTLFGERQAERYRGYFDEAIRRLGSDAEHRSSRDRSDLLRGLRSLHLSAIAGKSGAASHVIYYRRAIDRTGAPVILFVRILHERRDARLHVGKAATDDPPPT